MQAPFLYWQPGGSIGGEALSVKHIIPKNQTARFAVQEIGSQYESLCQSVRLFLNFIGKTWSSSPVPNKSRNIGKSRGVEIINTSRIPANTSVDNG